MSKIEFVHNNREEIVLAEALNEGAVFRLFDGNDNHYYMKVKPSKYLLNSKTIQGSLKEHKSLVVNLSTSNVFFIEANRPTKPVKRILMSVTP